MNDNIVDKEDKETCMAEWLNYNELWLVVISLCVSNLPFILILFIVSFY